MRRLPSVQSVDPDFLVTPESSVFAAWDDPVWEESDRNDTVAWVSPSDGNLTNRTSYEHNYIATQAPGMWDWLESDRNNTSIYPSDGNLTNRTSYEHNYIATQALGMWAWLESAPHGTHAETAWRSTNSTPDTVVAVIDSGIARVGERLFLHLLQGYDFVSDNDTSVDGDGRDTDPTDPGDGGDPDFCPTHSWHGTRVGSILAARHDSGFPTKGIAENCSVLPVRVLGFCSTGYATDVGDAIVWSAGGRINGVEDNENPAEIISLSLVGEGACPGYLQSSVNQALELGAVVVAAAGNEGRDVAGFFPANCEGVISVAASSRNGKLAGYSNYGADVSGPGGDSNDPVATISADQTGSYLQIMPGFGTSFAVPHVAGILALAEGLNATNIDFKSPVSTCNMHGCSGGVVDVQELSVQAAASIHDGCNCEQGQYSIIVWTSGFGVFTATCSCTSCAVCPSGLFRSDCSGSNAGWCEPCSSCAMGKYAILSCSLGSDIVCSDCPPCPDGYYRLGCAGGSSNSPGSCIPAVCSIGYLTHCPINYNLGVLACIGPCECPAGYYYEVVYPSEVISSGLPHGEGCLPCPAGTYSSTSNSGDSCTACTVNCASGFYRTFCGEASRGTCQSCPTCQEGRYRVGCSGTSTGSCELCVTCSSGSYLSGCSGTSAGPGTCVTCPVCSPGTYSLGCSGRSEGVCNACTTCSDGQYLNGCSGTSAGSCASCGTCSSGSYLSGCSGTSAGSCVTCPVCSPGTYSVGCSDRSPGNCTACASCPSGSSRSGCTGTSEGRCANCSGYGTCDNRFVFKFDTRSGDYQLGPDGSVGYTGASAMPAALGSVTVSTGATTVNGQTIPRGMQIWTVGTTGWYDIVAGGASGADYLGGSGIGGRGVAVSTRYFLTAGAAVIILVGAKPTGCASFSWAGGGGGSFVTLYSASSTFSLASQHTLLLAAGGGGGTGENAVQNGVDASTGTSGTRCRWTSGSATVASAGGGGGGGSRGGGAGVKGSSSDDSHNGGGGAGYLADGGDGWTTLGVDYATQVVLGGKSFLAGGIGGSYGTTRKTFVCTGFESVLGYPPAGFGGGGSAFHAGGGGGGYSGGQGCGSGSTSAARQGGGGGGSYNWNVAGNAGTLYSSWETGMFGSAPAGFASGYMSGDGTVAISALNCNAGTFATATGLSACTACPLGTYSTQNFQANTCTPCEAGRYGSATGLSVCETCPVGTFTQGTPQVSGTLTFTTNGVHGSCSLASAFLDSGGGWCGLDTSVNNYFLVGDLGSVQLIGSVTTQGRAAHGQWVTQYDLSHSLDSTTWTFFRNLVGNVDMNTKVTHDVNIIARYLRFTPTGFNNHPSMRVGHTASRLYPEQVTGQLTFTTNGDHSDCTVSFAALDSARSWCAASSTVGLFFLVADTGGVGLIDSVTTQGRATGGQWVTAYDLSHSLDSTTWTFFGNLVGNTDATTKVTRTLNVVARYLRFTPTAVSGWPSMRVGHTASTRWGARILASSCTACPAGSTSNPTRTGCVAIAGFYHLDRDLLAHYPFRPENMYVDASGGGFTLTDTNGASYKPQSEFRTGPFSGAGVAYFNNPGVNFAGVGVNSDSPSGNALQSFRASVGAGLSLSPFIGTGAAPGTGFTWCYWLRNADGATAGVLNNIQYPVVFSIASSFLGPFVSGHHSFVDGRNSGASDTSQCGTNMRNHVNNQGGIGAFGVFTRNWVHYCVVVRGRAISGYVNCASPACAPASSGTLNIDAFDGLFTQILIGQGTWAPALFGWFSDVRLYRKALTPAEVFAVRSYAATTTFSVNGAPSLLAYYPFRQGNIYADASGNGYTLENTNAGHSPVFDGTTEPFPGAGSALLDNAAVGYQSTAGKTFRISVGAGLDLRAMIGTQDAPGPGFTFCGWYRGRDGSSAGTVNSVQWQALLAIFSHAFTTNPQSSISNMFMVHRTDNTNQMSTSVRAGGTSTAYFQVAGAYLRTWTHYCAALSGRTVNVYFDCSSASCSPTVRSLSSDVASDRFQFVYIGQSWDSPWHGWVSEFRFYRRALTAAEVFAIRRYDGTSPTAVQSVNAGLLAHYQFHPNAFLTDSSDVTGDLIPTGSPASVPGSLTDLQGVVYFAQTGGLGNSNAARQFFTIPQISLGPSVSICLWYNPDSSSGALARLITLVNSATNVGMISIRREETTNDVAVEILNAASITTANTGVWPGRVLPGLYRPGVWHHLCLTISGTTARVYYQGTLFDTITLSTQKERTTYTSSYLGQNQWSGDLYRGHLDEVRIYGRAISQAEVTSIFNYRGDSFAPAVMVACPVGSYLDSSVTVCTACAAGTFASATGRSVCAGCAAGTYGTATGMTVCANCPANSWSVVGAGRCTANQGFYNLDDSANLRAYYTFNPGALLQDTTGITGSLTASASSPTAQVSDGSNSAFFTGSSSQFFTLPSLILPNAMSVCSWFWISSSLPSRNWNRIFDFGNGASSSNILGTIHGGGNNLFFEVYSGASSLGGASILNGAQTTNSWRHACMTLSGNSVVGWLDGSSTSSSLTNARAASITLSSNFIGKSNWAADGPWWGAIDEFRIYHKALTSTEVNAVFNWQGDTYVPMIILACPPCAAGSFGSCTTSGAPTCAACSAGTFSMGVGMTASVACTGCSAGTFSTGVGMLASAVCTGCSAGSFSASTGLSVCSPCTTCTTGQFRSSACTSTANAVCIACAPAYTAERRYPPKIYDSVSAETSTTFLGQSVFTETLVINPAGVAHGSGVYELYSSSRLDVGSLKRFLFDFGADEEKPHWAATYLSGTYQGGANIVSGYTGDWIVVKFPSAFRLTRFIFKPRPGWTGRVPGLWRCYGSNNGVEFVEINAGSQATRITAYDGHVEKTLSPAPIDSYLFYGWVVKQLVGGNDMIMNFGEFEIYGQELLATFSSTTDASACTPCTSCPAGQFTSTACTLTANGACQACRAGTYSGSTASPSCVSCLAGTYNTGTGMLTSSACISCAAGTFSTSAGSSVCTACVAGTFLAGTGGTSITQCTQCGSGTFSATVGAQSSGTCQACSAGKFFGGTGASVCTNCGPTSFNSVSGSTTCAAFACNTAGSYSSALGLTAATCLTCGAGTFRSIPAGYPYFPMNFSSWTWHGAVRNCQFLQMVNGAPAYICNGINLWWAWQHWLASYGNLGSLTYNVAGRLNVGLLDLYYSIIGPHYCSSCQSLTCTAGSFLGTVCASNQDNACAQCGAGGYSPAAGATVCTACGAGTFSTGVGLAVASTCTQCLAGTYSVTAGASLSSACTACAAGTFSGTTGLTSGTSCQACAAGTFSGTTGLTSGTSCQSCAAGTFSGTTGITSATLCQSCAAGTFSGTPGITSATLCQSCAAGTFSGTPGLSSGTSCQACAAGTFSGTPGITSATLCQSCAAGTFSGTPGLSSGTSCQSCAAGTFSGTPGLTSATSCQTCAAGTSSAATGATTSATCVVCSQGFFSSRSGAGTCTSCPANSWSSSGASICTANAGFYNLDASTNLRAYYTFNPGALLQDTSGLTGALTASSSSPTAQASGPWASSHSAFLTGSSSQFFTLPSLTLPNAMSVCSWFWISSSMTRNWNRVFDFGNGPNNDDFFVGNDAGFSNLRTAVRKATVNIADSIITAGTPANTWKHVCLVISGTSGNLWLDNSPQAFSMSNTRNFDTLLSSNYIGRSQFISDAYWFGAIDEFRIYHRALTSTEVTALYNFRGDTYAPMIILACPNPCAAGSFGGCTSTGAQSCTACSAGTFSTGLGMLTSAACAGCSAGSFSASAGLSVCSPCTTCTIGQFRSSACTSTANAVCTACAPAYTPERRYPPKIYDSVSAETSTTFLGQSVFTETLVINPVGVTHGSGTYELYSSSRYTVGTQKQFLFDFGADQGTPHWSDASYLSGNYRGSAYIVADYTGDWIVVKFPSSFRLKRFIFHARPPSFDARLPAEWRCYGSNDGINFVEIQEGSQRTGLASVTSANKVEKTLSPLPTQSYVFYGWTVNKILGSYIMNFGEFEIYGEELLATFSSTTDASACTPCTSCPAGQFTSTACTLTANGACQSCGAGTYSGSTGRSSCVACPAGTYSTALGAITSGTCLQCFAGTYFTGVGLQASASCTRCSAGTYSTASGATALGTCAQCFAGTYFTGVGLQASASCTACSAGTYSTASGATAIGTCQQCFAGSYFTGVGLQASASCTACVAGQFSTASGATVASSCQQCSAGTYATEQRATACTACPTNSNHGLTGAIQRGSCLCNAGFVGDLSNVAQTCTICPANSFCAGLSQTPCPANTRSPAQSSLEVHCRCVAGYRCRYGRDVQLVLRFSLSPSAFTTQESSIRAQIASAAGVSISNVTLVQSALASARRMLEVTAYVARGEDGLGLV